jgi:hypothetical protein
VKIDCLADLALADVPSATRLSFSSDPQATMTASGLTLRAMPTLATTRNDGGACDGISFLQDGIVLYAVTPGSRRENFTLAHEFGHWLVERNELVLDFLANSEEPEKLLESVCDRIAQQLLLPDEVVDSLVTRPVRAQHVLDMYEFTRASHPVCVIALAQRLPRLGAITIIDVATSVITTSSVHPDPDGAWPTVYPWPKQPVPAGHPLVALRPGVSLTRKTFWRSPWNTQLDYYMDAINDGRRIVAVLSDVDVWNAERLHLDTLETHAERPAGMIHCCGRTQVARGYPCSTCSSHYCPTCGKCACQKLEQREVTCKGGCFTRYLPHLLVEGVCAECRG